MRTLGWTGFVVAVSLAAPLLAGAEANAARRVALVIGNSTYAVGPLANPGNDADAVAAKLTAIGFDSVILRKDIGIDGFRVALGEVAREASGAEIALVYYAGHGTEHNGANYLIPTDAKLERASDLKLQAISLDTVLEQIDGASRLKLVVLDACRNNVFPLAGGKRSVTRGLGRVEPENNSLVVYAAAAGTTAEDGDGRKHSPFTEALLRHLDTPQLDVTFVFRRVRDDVMAATSPPQQPFVYGTIGGAEVYLNQAPMAGVPVVGNIIAVEPVERAWRSVETSGDIREVFAFRARFGKDNPYYDRLAGRRIDELYADRAESAKAEDERRRVAAVEQQVEKEVAEKSNPFVGRWGTTSAACNVATTRFTDAEQLVIFGAGTAQYITGRGRANLCLNASAAGWTFSAACEASRSWRLVDGSPAGRLDLALEGGRMLGQGPDGKQLELHRCP